MPRRAPEPLPTLTVSVGSEGRYLLDFDTRDLPSMNTQVLVVGGGVAGLCAALAAAQTCEVLLVLKDEEGQSNTAWAQGGIAAAVARGDTVAEHVADTLAVGGELCDPAVVRFVAGAAPEAIDRLVRQGARFDLEGGEFALGREGGHGQRRILHRGDATGEECDRVLWRAAHALPSLRILQPMLMVDLLTHGDRCVGVLALGPHREPCAIYANAVILAAGGAGRLFRETTNVRGATGDGIAAAYRAGAVVSDVEFVQFHPTTLYLAGSERVLVTEAVRGDGALLVDNLGERFLLDLHPAAELAPRDVVARAIVERLAVRGVTDVYLDMRGWPRGHAARRFPGLVATCARYRLDPERDLIPVRPAAHYFIGGVRADLDGRTSLRGLFACGEAARSGLHGANRLASNSLLEGLVLGDRTGRAATAAVSEPGGEPAAAAARIVHRTARARDAAGIDLEDLRKSLASRMWRASGVLREGPPLEAALDAIRQWRHFSARIPFSGRAGVELENLLLLGELVTAAALAREESRGAHARSDFPRPDGARFRGRLDWRDGLGATFHPVEAVPVA